MLLAPLKYGISALAGSLLMLSALLGSNLWTYHRLTHEVDIGVLSFVQKGDAFEAQLVLDNGAKHHFIVKGDEWQLDARVIKWKSWASLLGKDPLFKLDRLSGRYRDIAVARTTLPSFYSLADDATFDLWRLAQAYPDWLSMIDASYGSSVFLPLHDGAQYRIVMSQSGLLARLIEGASNNL